MPHHPCTAARTASYTSLLLAVSILVSLLLPTGAAWAATTGTAAVAVADDCAVLPLAPFGDPGSAVGRATVPVEGSACFTFTADKPGLHRVLLDDQHNETHLQVFDGDAEVACREGEGWCELPRAGAFTVKAVNLGWDSDDVTVAVVPLATDAGCEAEAGTSWDGAVVSGSAVSTTAILCHPFTAAAGERITSEFTTVKYGSRESWISDETGDRICPRSNEDGSEGCVLPGDGPYRVLSRVTEVEGGFPAAYSLKVRRLSDPAGCASVALNAYNSAPTTTEPATGCKTFSVPAAGRYDVYEVRSGERSALAVYDREGKTVCRTSQQPCGLPAAGDYTVFTDHAILVLDRAGTAGCEPAEQGTYEGTFAVAGEVDCLMLPFPEGARMAALKALNAPAPRPEVSVVDADGVGQCERSSLSAGTCALTGRAPFRALASTGSGTGSYRIALHRTDAVSGCPVLPAGDFTGAGPAGRFSTGDGVFSQCFGIPAADHSAMENFQLQAVSGTFTAQFSVLDADGKQVCSHWSNWTTCGLTPGVAHTVLVTGSDAPATYTMARRDVTATAKGCTANPATPVGGPSTSGAMGATGELLCRQVTTADARDSLHLNVRDPLGTTNILAYDAGGKAVCSNRNRACGVTGSTSYQVLLTVPANLKAPASYRFDALRIATAAGPAAECAKVANISYGYGPITGTLTEQRTAVCAALPTAYSDSFDFRISDTAGGTETAVPALYDSSLDNNCSLKVSVGYYCHLSEAYTKDVTPSILVLGLPEKASQTSYSTELVCSFAMCGTEKVSVGIVTPATGVSGAKVTVKVAGTALHMDDKVRIGLAGKTLVGTTTSVSADRKTLTAVLDLTGAAVGDWNLSVLTHTAGEYLRGTFSVTAAPVKNTTAPTITGTVKVGAKVTAGTGAWTPAATSYGYQWKADGTAISGATGSAYTVPAALLGKKLTVTVTARRTGHPSGTATTAAVIVAKGSAPKVTTAPAISGTAKVGRTLKAAHGTWTPAPTSYGYQWYANGTAITGATTSSLVLKSAQAGKKITVKVTARRTGHTSGTALSKPTSAVAR
ncbi:hypothetical protein J7E96_30065 [Streptomyces sp. ISL-96]|uniref:hypothetical protein n=1 Tax=Streptomyces sp. ISL-96 TaxID=2819191 RepID=UPI001BEB9334|nr:hypothetical protein [Streptomyces sp. ISL-96]MBT2492682.1 hypothetical protein [Streptomyces sp. ISL-96]